MIFEGLLSRLQSERIRLRTAYNAGSPINRLPAEILSGIFLLHVDQVSESREISLRNLAVVCKLWKDLVLRSPPLWTVLDARLKGCRGFIIASVSRSKGLPLTVNTTERWLSPNNRAVLLKFAPQIQSLSYTGAYHDIIEVYLPTLRNLQVIHEDHRDINDTLNDHSGGLAITAGVPFRSLSLKGISLISCAWERFKHLQVINLIDVYFCDESFITLFLHALAASTKLQMLVVHHLSAYRFDHALNPITDVPELYFPILHTISITRTPTYFTTALMERISTPQCGHIVLDDLGAQEISACGWLVRALQNRLRHASKLEIQVIMGEGAPYDLSNTVGNEWVLITHYGELNVRLERLAELGRFLKDTNCGAKIILHIEHHYDSYHTLALDVSLAGLQSLGNVVQITMGRTCHAIPLLKALTSVEDGQTTWPCPNLRSIQIDTSSSSGLYKKGFLGGENGRWEILWPDDGSRLDSRVLILQSLEFQVVPPPGSFDGSAH